MGRQPNRRIRITPHRKRKPDYRKMSAALQAFLAAQAEADAEAEAAKGTANGKPGSNRKGSDPRSCS